MTAGLEQSNLFKPIIVGKNTLDQRVVFAPTTRFRAVDDHTPSDLMLQYYSDRAQAPGSLIITEATFISPRAGLYPNIPGIWNDKHVQGWKKITDAVHAKGSYMACQVMFLGRVGSPELLKKHGLDLISPSAIYKCEESKKAAEAAGNPVRALTEEEIKGIIYEDYKNAAINAMEAGFDYVEIHSAHGYMLDQFLQPATNQRTDNYGGSIEKRARIVLEIIDLLSDTIGAEKLAIRLSPWAKFQGMKAEQDTVHPITTFSYIVNELQKRANNAINAMEAGFDYVEIHSAHGYMLDQFLQPATNQRTDNYGGSIEKRARIVLEIIDLLSDTIGAEKLAIRLSPWAKFQGMKAEQDTVHPITTFSYIVNELQKRANNGKQLAYLSLVEPRVQGIFDVNASDIVGSNDFIKKLWKGAILHSGNYTYDSPEFKLLKADVNVDNRTMIGFSRYFTSNPDLIERLRRGLELTPYIRSLFYATNNYGYNTFANYGKELQFDLKAEEKRRPVSLI
ncbi:NADPH dehydrogenase [Schizosaccharomyces cryophilus OY26]|uniref:NADPH dehydrogenase n=1 Tax=Schizosaccharomyces cryophilus (strain OY26 / ATCC MYA-4695 / CBS 11777 / NBRC 106824 / NRRL Y48691) TaxID=653667 RepID=S9WWN4_SCHCR|nr:NADPH dehydrogenase [Schizosaccharomyces cryophilus OY26]EPY49157.1 NADPH dehydrogenase [Schizosaccharomyces cryophilus OY26]